MAAEIHKLTIYRFRKLIGAAGLLLPICVPLGYGLGNQFDFFTSLSAYYYSYMNIAFVAVLILCGVFLIFYGGYEPEADEKVSDNTWTSLMGILIIITAMVPTTYDDGLCAPICNSDPVWGAIHLASAFGFFLLTGWMCVNKFTKGDLSKPGKKGRNKFYRFCGRGIWVVCGLLITIFLYDQFSGSTFWEFYIIVAEIILLLLFGAAWNVKGKALYDLEMMVKGES